MSSKKLVAVVTGGASGLGKGAVRKLLDKNYNVALVDLPNSDGAKVAKEMPKLDGQQVIFMPADVSSDVEVRNVFAEVSAKFGSLNVLVNCAGVTIGGKLYDAENKQIISTEIAEKLMNVNIHGTVNPIRYAIPLMLKNSTNNGNGERGVIINTASIAAFEGQSGQALYAASKGAIASLTLPLARDLAPNGIRVMAIAPGIFDTPLMWNLHKKEMDYFTGFIPFPNRLGTGEDFGILVGQIIDNPYLNGETIRLDAAVRVPY